MINRPSSTKIKVLKSFLYSHSDISVENLPYNSEVIEFISSWKKQNSGKVYLISASYSKFIEKVAIFLALTIYPNNICLLNILRLL
jgi:hypothetical protein